MAEAHGGHSKYDDRPAPKFFPPELWPEPPSRMSNDHHYLISYHVNDKPISWGTVIEKVKK